MSILDVEDPGLEPERYEFFEGPSGPFVLDRRAFLRDVLDARDVEARVGDELGTGELQEGLLGLDADHRELGHAGWYVEVHDGPSAHERDHHEGDDRQQPAGEHSGHVNLLSLIIHRVYAAARPGSAPVGAVALSPGRSSE